MPKFLQENQVLGQQGEILIKQICLEIGLVFERVCVDTGIDGTIELRDPTSGEMLNLIIRAQVKATENLSSESESEFSFTCSKDDIDYWLKGNTPNILIVCRPSTKEAYWQCINTVFGPVENREKRTVRFNKLKHRFDAQARQALLELARPKDSGLYMEPPRQEEVLFSNLFEIKQLPPAIYTASTTCGSLKQVYAVGRANAIELPPEIIFFNGNIITVHDPRTSFRFSHVCDVHSSEMDDFADSFNLDELASLNNASELLFKCLQGFCFSLGLEYLHSKKRDHRLFFAPYLKTDPSGRLTKQSRSFHSASGKRSSSSRGMVSPLDRKGTGKIRGLKHQAFHADIHYLDQQWYVQLSPTYRYTLDGVRTKRNSADLLSGIKRLERNSSVFSNLRLWEEYLLDNNDGDLLRKTYPHLRLGPLLYFHNEVGIPDAAWRKEADDSADDAEEENLLQQFSE